MATLPPRAERWMRAPAPPAPPAAWQPRLRKANSWPRRPAEPPEDETPGMVRQLEVQVEALLTPAGKFALAAEGSARCPAGFRLIDDYVTCHDAYEALAWMLKGGISAEKVDVQDVLTIPTHVPFFL